MKYRLTHLTANGTRPFPENIRLGSDLMEDGQMKIVNHNGQSVLRRNGLRNPTRVHLQQIPGTDRTLFDLLESKTGFGLVVTFVVDLEQNGETVETELFEVTVQNLVADDQSFPCVSDTVSVSFATLTPLKFEWLYEGVDEPVNHHAVEAD